MNYESCVNSSQRRLVGGMGGCLITFEFRGCRHAPGRISEADMITSRAWIRSKEVVIDDLSENTGRRREEPQA